LNDKGLGIAIAIGIIFFSLMWAQTNGFASSPVASSDVTVQDSAPTIADDITRGYLPGYMWVDQVGPGVYVAVSTGAGAADWNKVD